MRVLAILSMVTVSLLAAATPASAAGKSFHFSVSGPGADGFWSTLPPDGAPVPNVVNTDTEVSASQQATNQNGTSFTDKFLFLDQFNYKFDRRGNFVFVSETFGEAHGPAVALTVDTRKLGSASAGATVPVTTCTAGRGGNVDCADGGTASVSAAWTGQGDIVRMRDSSTVITKGSTETSHFRGTFRNATATGEVNGSQLGNSLFAEIFNAASKDVFICHGC